MTASILQPGVTQFLSANGTPLVGGSVAFFVPNSTVPKNTWQDSSQTILNSNPVILNGAGEATIYGSGAYTQFVYDNLGNLQWEAQTVDLISVLQGSNAIWCGTATGSANTITLTPAVPIVSYFTGQQYSFLAAFSNTGAATVNISGLGSINITEGGSSVGANDIPAGAVIVLVYDGTNMQLLSSSFATFGGVTGEISMFGASAAPAGWLECNGSAISRTTYANLFAVTGTTFGTGNGTTTFNIPDMRGYFPRGWADSGSIDSGRSFGSTQADAIASHSSVSTVTDPTHVHLLSGNSGGSAGGASPQGPTGGSGYNTSAGVTPSATGITVATSYTGAIETRGINLALLFMIKT